ncbi:pyruvate dehydrogenase (acetyl-transferring) kinase isozyme 3, mitochondrial-like isoform X3 [Mesocricetus auratus]|nr:pyruvate dehydrogenase (acetyl-transferring) kinase isozyme 3, mitochondrial-like isoform X3 [Mesocricetus auratus]XP_040597204.1 pyruvate dehydrogenase (acetyl-transferring) kinase isozyme 3, mitochondrial-like isoform X3 [Mesocricetus auratus]XP_040597205.1 pyruvate dehydrogenase (acetyl-transferring) kinase isozyme 3, mitochondrial-like isoform X3 [Mesocricetus auratus]XP_040597206.1 pyruvate dehydrogenase (acetyl-transferring) kinase isozyme 3, mitochondrial-like isoform X3 [Mesocricetus 
MQSFLELLEYENKSPEDPRVLDNFLHVLINIRNRHNDVVPTMAQGMIEYKEKFGFDPFVSSNIQYFLDHFYTNRISFCMLINQHTLLFGGDTNPAHPKHIGSIDPTCNVADVVKGFHQGAAFQQPLLRTACALCFPGAAEVAVWSEDIYSCYFTCVFSLELY